MSVSRHTIYNVCGSVLPLALSLVTVPIYLKLVGPDRYGVLAIAWLLLGYFGLFDLGLGVATSFRVAALRDAPGQSRADTFWMAITVNLAMGLIGGLLLWAAADYFFAHVFKVRAQLRPEILASVPYLAASVPIATLTGVLTGALQGRERFLELNIVSVVSTALFQIIPLVIAWTLGPRLVPLLIGAVAARSVAAAVLGLRCHGEFVRGHKVRLVCEEAPKLLKYGGWVTLTSIFGPLLVIVDRFAIGAVLGATSVTIYSVPFQIAQRIQVLPVALAQALFPKMSSAEAEERGVMSENATRTLISLMSLPVLAGIFLIDPFLRLWVGARLGDQSAPIGRILLIGFWANAFALVPFFRLQAAGRPDLVTKVLLVQIPPYLLCLYFGMHYLGLWGAAMVFALRSIIDYFILNWISGSKFKNYLTLSALIALLILGDLLSAQWSITTIGWWASAIGLGAVMAVLCWRVAPVEVTERVRGWLSDRGWRVTSS